MQSFPIYSENFSFRSWTRRFIYRCHGHDRKCCSNFFVIPFKISSIWLIFERIIFHNLWIIVYTHTSPKKYRFFAKIRRRRNEDLEPPHIKSSRLKKKLTGLIGEEKLDLNRSAKFCSTFSLLGVCGRKPCRWICINFLSSNSNFLREKYLKNFYLLSASVWMLTCSYQSFAVVSFTLWPTRFNEIINYHRFDRFLIIFHVSYDWMNELDVCCDVLPLNEKIAEKTFQGCHRFFINRMVATE